MYVLKVNTVKCVQVIPIDSASHPWSNSSPSGELLPVLRACLPSMASKDWYPNKPSTANKQAHAGSCTQNAQY